MQGIFRKENTDKALKYGIYRHLPTYEKIIRNLVSFYIKIPGIKPVLLTALSVRIIDAAKTFDIIWAMTEGGPNSSSETISIIIYKTLVKYNNTGYASAMAVIFIIVLVVFTLVFMQSLWNPKKK